VNELYRYRVDKHAAITLITSAAIFAADAHVRQKRKELNEPYINHPLRVGSMYATLVDAFDAEAIAAGYLHDVVEDTDIPLKTIVSLFPTRTSLFVDVCTKWWKSGQFSVHEEEKQKVIYYGRIAEAGAMDLKFIDRIDNLHDFTRVVRMAPSKHSWAQKYYEKTKSEFLPLVRHVNQTVFEEFSAAYGTLGLALG
jgi:guanosine-3',5'-bis(diphosphate) 3'-pyrophosphohydrolase